MRYGVVAKLIDIPYPGPLSSAADFNESVLARYESRAIAESRLLLVDHISSPTALIFPVAELIEARTLTRDFVSH